MRKIIRYSLNVKGLISFDFVKWDRTRVALCIFIFVFFSRIKVVTNAKRIIKFFFN